MTLFKFQKSSFKPWYAPSPEWHMQFVIVLLYDDSIKISKKFIQTLVRAIASMTHAICRRVVL